VQGVGDGGDLVLGVLVELRAAGVDHVPAGGLEAEGDVFGEAVVDRAVDGDLEERYLC
jgi:hypothetical protein